jgi:ketosteroid isomerase-like protein
MPAPATTKVATMAEKEAGLRAHPDDLEAVRDWFRQLEGYVNALDFTGSYHLTHEDFLAFGTFADFFVGRDEAEKNQWRNVWPTISDFHFRLDDVRALVSPDRLFAVGLAVFDSTGYHEDGSTFARTGRATVSFDRAKVGDPWVTNHSHMSLMRGVPPRSFGKRLPK